MKSKKTAIATTVNTETDNTVNTAPKFNSITEILNDKCYRKYLRESLDEVIANRLDRTPAKEGFRYERDWYDRMNDDGVFNFEYFIEHIESVWQRVSTLSSDRRKAIEFIGDKALVKTINQYKS